MGAGIGVEGRLRAACLLASSAVAVASACASTVAVIFKVGFIWGFDVLSLPS